MSGVNASSATIDGRALFACEVLVVDDEPAVRELIRRVLSRSGYTCRVAGGALEAIASVEDDRPGLVISDIRMPERDGVWLLEQLKHRWPSLAVVMLTAVSEIATAVQCLKAGAADYLAKPINLDELLIAVHRAAEQQRLARENEAFRSDLESMREKGEELGKAFHVIESTYREALGALTNVSSERRPPREVAPSPARGSVARSASTAGQSPELVALHAGARLIASGASFLEVAATLGRELVSAGAARALGLWARSPSGIGIERLFLVGDEVAEARELALRSLSSASTSELEGVGAVWVSAPVFTGGAIDAVLVIGWQGLDSPGAVDATERLALYLATARKLERDASEKHRVAEELDLFHKLAIASRYSLDLQSVAHLLMDSLHRIVDYEVAGLLLLDEHQSLHIQTRSTATPGFVEQVQSHVLNNLKLTCGIEPDGELEVRVHHLPSEAYPGEWGRKLRSFVNVPLTVGDRVAGLIHVSSGRERAFTTEDTLFLHRTAHFLASSVQGVHDLLATVKGRIEQMVEHMTDGVLMLDGKGDVVALNRAARVQLRIDGERRPDRDELTKILELEPIELLQSERRSLRRVVCVQGVPYQLQLSPVCDDEDLVGAVVAFRNFTQEQRLDEMKTEFINVASHELRTPLTAIKNAIAILQGTRLGAVTDGQRRFLSLAERNVDQLTSIINDLLNLSKIESGKVRIELEPTDVAEPVEAAVDALLPRAEEARVSLDVRIGERLPEVYANGPSLQRIVTNLVGNAIKFTEPGGNVSIEVASSSEDAEPLLQLIVSDTGVGIPTDDLETIFEKFHQVENGRVPGVAGTGLGLPITRELVKAHYGRIHAESEPGVGSRFIVQLPVVSAEAHFLRELEQELGRAREQQRPLALVCLSLADRGAVQSHFGDDGYESLFADLVASAKRVMRRPTDRVLPRADLGTITVALPRTDRAGGLVFESRWLEDSRTTPSAEAGLDVNWTVVAYPDDGRTPRELLRSAASSVASMDSALA